MKSPCCFCLVLQFEVDSSLVGEGDARKHLHRLMVLHDLDRTHILMAYAIGGYAIFTTKQVRAFDIELVDVLALILDLAGTLNVDTRHTFEYVAD